MSIKDYHDRTGVAMPVRKVDNLGVGAPEGHHEHSDLGRLAAVQWGFRELKDVIEGRPIFHKKDERVEAHIFVATLALFLKRSLEHQPAAPLPELSGTDALAAMKSIGIAELSLNGRTTRLVSGGGRDARRILSAQSIKDLEPPALRNQRKEPKT